MRKKFLTILFIFSLLFTACRKSASSPDSSILDLGISDETTEAGELVNEANIELKKIKLIYKEHEAQKEELKEAMNAREIEKVKKIADALLYQINDGMEMGEIAISKIEKAQELNANEKYKEYLRLKEDALRKQLAAFEYRRKAAKLLRDGFGGTDKKEIEKAKAEWKDLEENFQKYMDVARELSQEANKLAKESMRKTTD